MSFDHACPVPAICGTCRITCVKRISASLVAMFLVQPALAQEGGPAPRGFERQSGLKLACDAGAAVRRASSGKALRRLPARTGPACRKSPDHSPATAEILVVRGDPARSALAAEAPTRTPLSATQPASVVGEAQIRANVAPTGGYDDTIRLTPSVLSISPNGPGLSAAAVLSIRGFQDGQYNVTFDGIPFADADDFTHHSNVYFTPNDLSQVAVDRGPGDASTIGNATFGGTVALQARAGGPDALVTPYATAGSDRTALSGVSIESGQLAGGGSLLLDGAYSRSDGTLQNTPVERSSLFFKGVQPVGGTVKLTLVATATRLRQAEAAGATRAQIARFGPDFALSNDPATQDYVGYNDSVYTTDFAYAGLEWRPADDVLVEDKLYTYGLQRHFGNGRDVNGGLPDGTVFGPGDVPGQSAHNGLRAVGTVARVSESLPFGAIKAGFWLERQTNSRSQFEVDETLGGLLDPVLPPVAGAGPDSAAIDRMQREVLVTTQPYAELDWNLAPRVTLAAGVKYAIFDRSVEAPVMEATRLPLNYGAQFSAPLPSITVNWRIGRDWSAYAQVAKGFLAPALQLFDVAAPSSGTIRPEQTWNYQVGTVWQGPGLLASADAYAIDFQDFEDSRTVGGEPQVFDEGDVDFLGLEADATVDLGSGLSLYGNGSLNSARERSSGQPVPNTPQATLAGGLLYRAGGWNAALLDKWAGSRYGDTDRQQGLDPFDQLDLSLGLDLPLPRAEARSIKVKLLVSNLLDNRKIDALAGYTVAGNTPLFFTQPGRTVFLSSAVAF